MLLGKLSGSSPKMVPLNDPTNLDEVIVTARRREVAPPSEDIPEIVVSGRRIPWYVWAAGGVVAFVALSSLARR